MIQKEQIQLKRKEIAEIRHAESVYRDIVARENEREDYDKRWFWELLQNAKDSVNENQNIKVKIEITDNQISFSHSGNPFELEDILTLILQGSTKSNKEGKTGRFGTGFITTYLLSKEVKITGKLTNNQGCFQFLLNRNATNIDQFYTLQQESNIQFEDSISEVSYLGDNEFQTMFTYNLDDKGKQTAKIGLKCIDELIPITQLFNEQIESVTVVGNEVIKTFSKSLIQTHDSNSINEWEINTLVNGVNSTSLKAYIQKDEHFDVCIITHFLNNVETVLPLTKNYPRLCFTFPLIGTEEIGIPIIINSNFFAPRVERDGIYLKKVSDSENELTNKEIIKKALKNSLHSFAEVFRQKNVRGIYELFNLQLSKDLKWVDHEWFNKVKAETFTILASKEVIPYNESGVNHTSLKNLTIPNSENEKCVREIWELLSKINNIKTPLYEEIFDWANIIESINTIIAASNSTVHLDYVWGVNELIDFVESKNTLANLKESLESEYSIWLNKFYSLIITIKGSFPLEKKICLNQSNNLRKAEGIRWDNCNDPDLISISDLLKLNFSDKLFSREIKQIHISSVENFNMKDATSELKTKLNNLTDSEVKITSFQEGNALFLKWLISKREIEAIRDLKVFMGASKKSDDDFVYDHFPKTEHLLLSPKSFFENEFPNYANLIRERDCLNDLYNKFLDSDNFTYLDENDFIYLKPIVIKTDFASIKLLELLIINENDLNLLRDTDGQLKYKFKITYTDFAYLTANDGHIYARNTTQKSSLERLRFLLAEAVEKDLLFNEDRQEIAIPEIDSPIALRQCLWVYRAKRLNWIIVKTESDNSDTKFTSETPSSKNLSELIRGEDAIFKMIRGSKQQLLLGKMNVGVSELIRNSLPTDELRFSWDKAITDMITSDSDPELVQEIFNDPGIKKEYERRLNERKLIKRNQSIGKLTEDLFKMYIEILKKEGISITINREPFGSDFVLTEESSDLINEHNEREGFRINNWLVELKATGKEYAAMTPLQAKTASEQKENYALIVIPLDGTNPDIEYLKQNAKVIHNIGYKIDGVYTDYSEVELKKNSLNIYKNGISVNIENQNIRFKVSSSVWNAEQSNIETFVRTFFKMI